MQWDHWSKPHCVLHLGCLLKQFLALGYGLFGWGCGAQELRKEPAAWNYAVHPGPVLMGSTHPGLTEGCVLGGGTFSQGERWGWMMLQPEGSSLMCWAGCGVWGSWKQGRDETCAVSCSQRLGGQGVIVQQYILFYIRIHSCTLKWSLDPPKSHGAIFSFSSAHCAQVRADRSVCAQCTYESLLFSCKVVTFLGWWWVCCM